MGPQCFKNSFSHLRKKNWTAEEDIKRQSINCTLWSRQIHKNLQCELQAACIVSIRADAPYKKEAIIYLNSVNTLSFMALEDEIAYDQHNCLRCERFPLRVGEFVAAGGISRIR